ncbi:MAG: hypothetical protein K2V38_15210 [Gemmataceae bacterium]|nr:hypothetical protein [Gemmataceae bacterium]
MPTPPDSKRCPECKSTNLAFRGARDHRPKGTPAGEPVARTVHVACRRCGASWDVLRRLNPPTNSPQETG